MFKRRVFALIFLKRTIWKFWQVKQRNQTNDDDFSLKLGFMNKRSITVVKNYSYLYSLLLVTLFSCSGVKRAQIKKDDGKLSVVFIQVNDVYEIAPLEGGKTGGVSRIATLKKNYLRQNPNTLLVMSGDFLSPSVFNTLEFQGKKIRGKQMVECMNSAGFNIAIFGNHEFDISETELQQRINESTFQWISSNAFHVKGEHVVPFSKDSGMLSAFPAAHIISLHDNDGTTAKIGFIGIVLPFNEKPFVSYSDPLTSAKELYNEILVCCDAVIALTHQSIADDEKLAREVPGLAAILGGHEHDMRFEKVGNIFITKAHANARTAYVVRVDIDKKNKKVDVKPELKELNENVALDSSTNAVVQKWIGIANDSYASLGFDPNNIILPKGDSLDGREAMVRNRPTNLLQLITRAMAAACPGADAVIVNAGSVRVDDILYPPISEYDILRTLPFGGGIREVEMRGSLFLDVLEAGRKNKGIGGYLQQYPVTHDSTTGKWKIKDQDIDATKIYRVGLNDFLLTGGEANLKFLNEKADGITKVYPPYTSNDDPRADIRRAVVRYLKSR